MTETAPSNGQVTLDFDSLTIEEIELVEDISEATLEDVMAGKARTTKVLRAMALVGLRRANPGATLADAGKVSIKGLNDMLGGESPLAEEPTKEESSVSPSLPTSRKRQGSPSKT
jgi:hypothetical protein